jgi:hypothetical protein
MNTTFTPAAAKGEPGTLIHGTMRSEDLIPAFLAECDRLNVILSTTDRLAAELHTFGDLEQESETVDMLMDHLSLAAPFGHYFGSNAGDGSDYGFWLTEEWAEALEERGIDESDWEAVLSICEAEGIEPENLCDAWEGEVSAYSEDQAGAAYAQQTAEDCGMIDDCAKWPHNCIDWDEAWRQLSMDGYSVHRLKRRILFCPPDVFGGARWAIVRAV